MEEVYLTPKEAAYQMGVAVRTVYCWLKQGFIRGERKGPKFLFIPKSEVLRVKRGN